jgi:hypothetical protein
VVGRQRPRGETRVDVGGEERGCLAEREEGCRLTDEGKRMPPAAGLESGSEKEEWYSTELRGKLVTAEELCRMAR